MPIAPALKTFLRTSKVKYITQKHKTAYTAQEIAASQHVPGRQLAKCVLVNTEKGLFLAVLPAIYLVDFAKLKRLLKVKKLGLASEADIKRTFPDADVGAMSVFGSLYNVPTVADKTLAASDKIVCNAGSHTETLTVRFRDFERVAKPKVGAFGIHIAEARKPKKKVKA